MNEGIDFGEAPIGLLGESGRIRTALQWCTNISTHTKGTIVNLCALADSRLSVLPSRFADLFPAVWFSIFFQNWKKNRAADLVLLHDTSASTQNFGMRPLACFVLFCGGHYHFMLPVAVSALLCLSSVFGLGWQVKLALIHASLDGKRYSWCPEPMGKGIFRRRRWPGLLLVFLLRVPKLC